MRRAKRGEVVSPYCATVRTRWTRKGKLNLTTGELTMGAGEWVTEPCGTPLFTVAERRTETCNACAEGWESEGSYIGPKREGVTCPK